MAKQDLSQAVGVTLWAPVMGLVTAIPPHALPDQATAECSNFYGFEGKIRPRPGWSAAYGGGAIAAGTSVYGLAEHVAMNGTRTVVAMTVNLSTGSVKFWERSGGAWVDRTGAAVLTGYEYAPYQPTFANFKGVLYFTTGRNGLYQFTPGGNISAVTNATASLRPFNNPKIVISWDGRLFTFNQDDAASAGNPVPPRVAWSDFLDATVWQGGLLGGSSGYQDLYYGNDSSDPIVAAIDLRDNLVVFKPGSMYAGVNTGDAKFYEFRPLFRDVGCVAQNTLRRLRETVMWMGYDNVYAMTGLSEPEPIGDAIRTHIQEVSYSASLKYANAVMDPIKQLYHLFLPMASGSHYIQKWFTFNIKDKSWWESDIAASGLEPVCSMPIYNNPLDITLYCGSRNGKIYSIDHSVFTDDGTKYTCSWASKQFDAGNLFKSNSMGHEFDTFQVQKLAVLALSGKCKIQLKVGPSLDQQRTTSTLSMDFNGAKSERYVTFREGDRFVQVILTETDLTSPSNIEGLTMHIQPRGMVI